MKKFLKYIIRRHPEIANRIGHFFLPKLISNINIDICDEKQKRVLILYCYMIDVDYNYIRHANQLQATQMIHYFISRGYCVDYCFYDDWDSIKTLKEKKYDVIVGQGGLYKEICKTGNIPVRVCLLSENHPETVKLKYHERLDYFLQRHPHVSQKHDIVRTGILDVEQFRLSTHGILMNSRFNANNYTEFKTLFLINANAMFDPHFVFNEKEIKESVARNKKRVLWFGSSGIIHKGLDIVIDVVKKMPELELNCYGVKKQENYLFNQLAGNNTINRGHVNVMSNKFYHEVVLKHNFVIFPSCSEGMATSVATCMAYGIIPVVTKETGFNPCDCIILLDDYKEETIRDAILNMRRLPDEKIFELRKQCYYYARENFSLKHFDESFEKIMDNILSIANKS